MTEKITSAKNPKIKELIRLCRSRNRKRSDKVVVEGSREIFMALESGFDAASLFICTDLVSGEDMKRLGSLIPPETELIEISRHVFESAAYRGGSDGLILLAHPIRRSLNDLKIKKDALVVALETVEKPGNLGAIARTAEAAGCDAILICNPLTDIYNPNTIRSSLGCIFSVPAVACTNEEALQWLHERKIPVFSTYIDPEARSLYKTDLNGPAAIVLGSEAEGISPFWIENSDQRIVVPMQGKVNSMNVSATAAIIIFEALRQRTSE